MSGNQKSNTNFLMQGSILAAASIISRVIGLVYRIPLQRIIGDRGMDFYATAFEVYSIVLLISSYSLPLAVSKLVSARVARGQRKNAYRYLRGAFLFALVTGTTAGLIVWFFSKQITQFFETPLSFFSLQFLAPCLVVAAVMGVLRGFFQGLGTMVPSAISQVIEQIVNAVVSVMAAYFLYQYGAKIGAVLGDPEKYGSAYGAAGGTLGTLSGAVVGFVFILVIFLLYRTILKRQMKRDHSMQEESYGSIIRILILTIVPVLLSTTIYNVSAIIDTRIFKSVALMQGYTAVDIGTWWGKYTGKYRLLINVPISIASALAASTVPALSASYAKKDRRRIEHQINAGMRLSMIIAVPCAVGLFVFAGPVMELLFNDTSEIAARMLQAGCVAVIFYSLSTLSNGILQGVDRMRIPVINAVLSLAIHIGSLYALLYFGNLNIFAVIIANVIYGVLMCIFNQIGIRRATGYRFDLPGIFLRPAIASAVMGAASFGLYKLVRILFGNTVSTIVAMVGAFFVYFVVLLLIRGISESDLKKLPKGTFFVSLAKKMHLLR